MSSAIMVMLIIGGEFLIAALASKWVLRLSWTSVGVACGVWILCLAFIWLGIKSREEAMGWTVGFAFLLTLPAVIVAAVAVKLAGIIFGFK